MGLDILWEIRTTDFNKIQKMFAALSKWAENTQRYYRVYEQDGFVQDETHDIQKLNGGRERYDAIYFSDKNQDQDSPKYFREIYPSKMFGLEIGLKTGGTMDFGFVKVKPKERVMHGDRVTVLDNGGYYCIDWVKLMGPSGRDPTEMINQVVEIDAILEFIEENFFSWPELRFHDETDFHKTPISQVDTSQKNWWKELRDERGGKDYFKVHAQKKNHDLKNILVSIGEIKKVFSIIEGQTKNAGWTDEQMVKGVPIIGKERKMTREMSTVYIGNKAIQTMKDEIKGIKAQIVRPRVVDLTAKGPKNPVRAIGYRRMKK